MDVLVDQLADIALQKYKPAPVSKLASTSQVTAPVSEASLSSSQASPSSSHPQAATLPSSALESSTVEIPASTPALGRVSTKEKSSPFKRSRYIPTRIRRQVLLRDQNGCTYQDPKSGRICGTRHGLQLDHIMPFSWGGEHSADNLTLRCGAHNRFRAELMRFVS
jgi:hypothetical protein